MEQEKITITIPSEILPIVAKKKGDVPIKVFEFLILELYRLGELSSGKAAQYLNMERFEFVRFASEWEFLLLIWTKMKYPKTLKRPAGQQRREKNDYFKFQLFNYSGQTGISRSPAKTLFKNYDSQGG